VGASQPFPQRQKGRSVQLVRADGGLDSLIAQGAIVLACNLATMAFAGIIAKRVQRNPDDVKQELRDGLVPGVTLVPSGVFAVIRSEEAGCNYLRAT
jgi:intracellular sulfur oxidation DsrE/DsrF family protein